MTLQGCFFFFCHQICVVVSESAASSCKEPFLGFHRDTVRLKPKASFLPKVVSSFHPKQKIVHHSLHPAPNIQKDVSLHCLDVVRAV